MAAGRRSRGAALAGSAAVLALLLGACATEPAVQAQDSGAAAVAVVSSSGASPDPAAIIEVPQPAPPAPAPVVVQLPGIGEVAVVPSGVTADGVAEIPEDISTAGWYQYGAAPGDADGATVLMGHRDSRGGTGALFALGEVPVGATVTVVDAAGVPHAYRVVSNEVIDKRVVPLAELFDRVGPRSLVVISCGGPYDRAAGGYRDNIVLRAVPA